MSEIERITKRIFDPSKSLSILYKTFNIGSKKLTDEA